MVWSSVISSVRDILIVVPWPHWVAIGVLTLLAVAAAIGRFGRAARKRSARAGLSAYGAVALAIAVFAALLFVETTVVVRWCGYVQNGWGIHLNLDLGRIFHIHSQGYESLFNIVAFVPFGFFLAEYLAVSRIRATRLRAATTPAAPGQPASTKFNPLWRAFAIAVLATFCLSLCIECLQLALHVGFFELTDLVMNTLGGLVGALISLLFRMALKH